MAKNAGAILWKIEKEGRPASYLFGTVHLTDDRVTDLSPAVKAGLNEAKVVALEVSDLSENATASVIASSAPLVMFTDGRRLDTLISTTEYDAVKSIIGRSGMPVEMAAVFKPWIVTMILSVSDCERTKVQQGARVLDMKIAEIGKSRGLQVVGLETIPAQLEALAAVPEQQQVDMLRASLKFADRTDDLMETLVQLYLTRKITAAMPFQIALAKEAGVSDQAFVGLSGEAADRAQREDARRRRAAARQWRRVHRRRRAASARRQGPRRPAARRRLHRLPHRVGFSPSRFPTPARGGFVHAAFHSTSPIGRGRKRSWRSHASHGRQLASG